MIARILFTLSVLLLSATGFAAPLQLGDIIVGTQSSGNLYRIDPISGAATLLTSDNLLFNPSHVIVDKQGRILTAERTRGPGIVRFDPVTNIQTLIVPTSVRPFALAFDQNNDLVFGDANQRLIRVNLQTGNQTTLTTLTGFEGSIQDIEVDALGRIVVVDSGFFPTGGGKVVRYDPTIGLQTTIASGFGNLADLVVTPDGNYIVANRVANTDPTQLIKVSALNGSQQLITSVPSEGFITLQDPNTLLYADFHRNLSILKINLSNGQQETLSNFHFPFDVIGIAVVVPELSTFALLAIGGIGICLHRKRRRIA